MPKVLVKKCYVKIHAQSGQSNGKINRYICGGGKSLINQSLLLNKIFSAIKGTCYRKEIHNSVWFEATIGPTCIYRQLYGITKNCREDDFFPIYIYIQKKELKLTSQISLKCELHFLLQTKWPIKIEIMHFFFYLVQPRVLEMRWPWIRFLF